MNPPARIARSIAKHGAAVIRLPARQGKAGAPYARCPYRFDHRYPLIDSDGKQIGHCIPAAISHEPLRMTAELAKAEGHDSLDAMKRAWVREHDSTWIALHSRDFAWARYTGQGALSWILLQRYAERWEGREAWVILLERADGVRFMADQRRAADGDGQYTTTRARALDPDAECVDADYQARFAKTAESFCIGRQLARAQEAQEQRASTKTIKHPAPWWKQAA